MANTAKDRLRQKAQTYYAESTPVQNTEVSTSGSNAKDRLRDKAQAVYGDGRSIDYSRTTVTTPSVSADSRLSDLAKDVGTESALDERNYIRDMDNSFTYTPENVSDNLDRINNLLSKENWTDRDIENAKSAHDALTGASAWQNLLYGITKNDKYETGAYQKSITDADASGDWTSVDELGKLAGDLNSRLHPTAVAIGGGIIKGTGAESVAKAITSTVKDEDAKETLSDQYASVDKSVAQAAKERPLAYGAANVAGSLALLSGVSGLTVAAFKLGAAPVSAVVKTIAQNALAFAGMDAVQNVGDYTTGAMTGEQFGRSFGASLAGGAAGTLASGLVSSGIAKVLSKTGLQTPFMEYIRGVASGTSFAGGDLAAMYSISGEKPTKQQMATDLTTAFLFSAITSGVSTYETTQANKAVLMNQVTQMQNDYMRMANGNLTAEERIAAADNMLAYSQNCRAAISQTYYAGQQKYINEVLKSLDALDEIVTGVKNTAQSTVYTGNALGEGVTDMTTGSAGGVITPVAPVSGSVPSEPIPADEITGAATAEVADLTSQLETALSGQPLTEEAPIATNEGLASPAAVTVTETPVTTPVQPAASQAPAQTVYDESQIKQLASALGENGGKAFAREYGKVSGSVDPSDFFGDFARVYNIGKKYAEEHPNRTDLNQQELGSLVPDVQLMDSAQIYSAFYSGVNDAGTNVVSETTQDDAPDMASLDIVKGKNGDYLIWDGEEQVGTISYDPETKTWYNDMIGKTYNDIDLLEQDIAPLTLPDADGVVLGGKSSETPDDLANKILTMGKDHPTSFAASIKTDEGTFVGNGLAMVKVSDGYTADQNTKILDTKNARSIISAQIASATEPLTAKPTEATQGGLPLYVYDTGRSAGLLAVQKAYLDMFKGYDLYYCPNDATKAIRVADDSGNTVALIMPVRYTGKTETANSKPSTTKPVTEKKPTDKAPESKPAAKPEPKQAAATPYVEIADAVNDYLSRGQEFSPARLYELCDKAYGGTMASGAYTIKDAYDAMELGINKWILTHVSDANKGADVAVHTIHELEHLLELVPTQTKRTEEQETYQQFSTPPALAYAAAWLAKINSDDVVLEPSAGIGGLAVFAKAWGAGTVVNELSKRRIKLLSSLGFDRVYNENAEQIDNILPDDVKPSVVIMNPPFSSTAGRTATNKTSNAIRHVEQALDRLEDNGRLVAILGKGMSDDSKTFASWWNELRENYDIKANISIDGSNYKKYGTTFGNQIVIIDKTGPQMGRTFTGEFKDLTEIPRKMEVIRNAKSDAVEHHPLVNSGESSRVAAEGNSAVSGASDIDSVRPGGDRGNNDADAGRAGSNVLNGEGAGGRSNAVSGANSAGSAVLGSGTAATSPEIADVGSGINDISGNVRGEPEPQRGNAGTQPVVQQVARKKAVKNDDGVYAEYEPSNLPIEGAKKHPAPLVESAAMAAVSSPAITYVPDIPKSLITSGDLSAAQLENICYAGQAHSQLLPDGTRKGYFIGDGTGVGKGRQIVGIILDNMNQGRTKAVWVSKNKSLYNDAIRDWTELGQDKNKLHAQFNVNSGATIKDKDGISFTTYDTLKTEKKGKDGVKGQSRLQQLADWLGKDFDGVIVFDEAHSMGNLLGAKGARGKTKPSARALAGVKFQKMLPNARVVYASATAASNVQELAFAERLGLWGTGTAFNNVNEFVDKISTAGIAAMELVARDMKALGVYLARSISYDGVGYTTLNHDLDPIQTEIYDTMCEAWQITLDNMDKALDSTNANKNPGAKSRAKSAYYSAMQRFYNQVLTSMSMPSVISDMRAELDAGHSCVLQIVNTNQAAADRELARIKADENADIEDIDLTPRGALLEYLNNSFPVEAFEPYTDENGNELTRPVLDSSGKPVLDKKAVAMRDELISKVTAMSIPDGPLEMLFDAFGTDAVSEVTGRTRRVVPKADESGNISRVEESRSASANDADVEAFQSGKKRILVFSDAGGTGKSYHADKRAKNQQKRAHYVLQPGWNASKATQGFGRTHRSNEINTPIFKLVTTNIKGQKRFVSTIARRLDQLGALTKGQRETGSGIFTDKDNLESDLARDSLRNFYDKLGHVRYPDIDAEGVFRKLGLYNNFYDPETNQFHLPSDDLPRDMGRFLNRILVLKVAEQNAVFDAFNEEFENTYNRAKESGNLELGLENVRADKIEIIDDRIIRTDKDTGATTNYVQAKTFRKPELITSVAEAEEYRIDFQGLYRVNEGGEVRAVYRIKDHTDERGRVHKMYRLQSPVIGQVKNWQEETLKASAKPIAKAEWGKAWDAEVAAAPEYNENTVHILTGVLLPIWNRLPESGSTRAMRLTADDGTQYLGRLIPANQIDDVLRALGLRGRTKETYTAPQLMDKILQNGVTVHLSYDRVKLFMSRVSGDKRIELSCTNEWALQRRYPDIIEEKIQYRNRFFIPTNAAGAEIIEKLIAQNPVRNVEEKELETTAGDYENVDQMVSTTAGTKADVGYALSADGKTANFTEARLKRLFDDYSISGGKSVYHMNYAKAYVTYISPNDFLSLTSTNVARLEAESKPLNLEELQKETQDIHLTYDPDYPGEVWGHEGRHRMIALKNAGVTKVAIAVHFSGETGKYDRIPINSLVLSGEDFGRSKAPGLVTLKNLLPLSSAYRDQIYAKFGAKSEVNYSKTIETSEGKWSAMRVGDKDKAPMPLSDIISKIRHDFGIPVTKGGIRGKSTLGEYRPHANTIRTKVANDLPTVAHELGHYLDHEYDLTNHLDPALKDELSGGMTDAMRALYPEKKWTSEGLAEFVRKYLQNRETAAIDYPKFAPHFNSTLGDALLQIDELADEINAYYSLDADTASSAIKMSGERGKDFRTFKEKAGETFDRIYQAWIDSNHGIKRFDEATGASTYKLASNSAYSDAIAYSLLTGALTDIHGQRVADGLIATLKDIKTKSDKEYRDFGEYLIVKHGPERLREGMRIFADDRKNSTIWMNNRQAELERQYPEFKGTSEKLYNFQRQFLKTWGVDTGLVSPESFNAWGERWEFYVPLNRDVSEKGRIGAKRGFANQNSTIKKAIGSGLDIVHPVDNIINNIVKMVNAGTRNNVMRVITIWAKTTDGSGLFLEHRPMPVKKKTFDATKLKDDLKQATIDAGLKQSDEDAVFDIINNIDDILVQYGRGKAYGDIVTVLNGGTPEYWKINDPLLLSSITNLSPARLPAILEAYGRVSRFITGNITGNNVLWSIFSNFPRDLITYFTFSEYRNPLKMLGGIGSAYINKVKGNKSDPLYKEFVSMGGGRTSAYTADKDLTKNIRRKMYGDKKQWINPLEWVEFAADTVELGPRFSYYKILRGKGFSPEEAFYGSADITVNFRRGGPIGRELNKVIPFFNAGVQGLDKFARWISAEDAPKAQRAKTVRGRVLTFIAVSAALAALTWIINSGDEEAKKNYAQLSNYTKNTYWCIPLGDGKYFTVPKPRDLAVMTSFFETCLEYYANGNDKAFEEFYAYFADQCLPNVINDVAKGDLAGAIGSLGLIGIGAYMMANRDFLGKPIVSSGLSNLEPKDQYTDRTSKIAYWVGQAFNLSPVMVDYFFQQTLGGWWKAQKALFPVGSENVDFTLGIQNQYIRDNQFSTDLVNRLYDAYNKSLKEKNSNPDDMGAAVAYKWYNTMTTFYSRYYKLAKGESETTGTRATRQTVLNMISEFEKNLDNGYKTSVQKYVEDFCKKTGETAYMPSVVQSTLTYTLKSGTAEQTESIDLNASQYVQYQTEYLTTYWDYIESSLDLNTDKTTPKIAAILKEAKSQAADDAKAKALKRLGITTEDYSEYQAASAAGVSPAESVLFNAAYNTLTSDKDADGKTIPNSKQDKVIDALDSMKLTDEERSFLFGTVYSSDKNNPYN